MKINDFIFRFDSNGIISRYGICRVRIFVNSQAEVYVLLTELDENPSSSVTNSIESICQQLLAGKKIPEKARIIEHYPRHSAFSETFDLVTFDAYFHPDWKPIGPGGVLKILECGPEEFEDYRKDPRVLSEIRDAIDGIPKLSQFRYTEDPRISERRLEIFSNQYTKQQVQDFISSGPAEQEISAFLKKDLSLIAECYASPSEEYVCFSEYPIGPGRVDFLLLTGRSRMSVYLIEIKGARDTLCRKNHYRDFRSSIQEGRSQLLQRADWIESHYDAFRRTVHETLKEVKQGRTPFGAFPGPKYKLSVDPNKDI